MKRKWRWLVFGLMTFATVSVAEDVPSDEAGFTDFVASRLRTRLSEAEVSVKGPLTIGIAGLQLNLDRVFNFCHANADRCTAQIENLVSGAMETYQSQHAPPEKEAVRLVVRTTEYVDGARSAPEGTKGIEMQARPFIEGLYVLPVIDNPRTVRYLRQSDNEKLGLSADQVFELGLANLKQELPPLMSVAKVAGRKQVGNMVGSFYYPSRMLLVDSWAPLAQAQGGVLIVAIPATDAVFYIGEDTPVAIDALRTLTRMVLARAPTKLSGDLYRWRAAGWEKVP
jgi:uncharacterized protein YtpQ (UPF0354 family)